MANNSLLVTGDQYIQYQFNYACTTNEVGPYGNWSLDGKTPNSFKEFKIGLYHNRTSQVGKRFQEIDIVGLVLNVRSHELATHLYEYDDTLNHSLRTIDDGHPGTAALIDPKDRHGWHNYRIERNSSHVSYLIDENLILSYTLTTGQLDSIDTICLIAETGSNVVFDNVVMSSIGDKHPISSDVLPDQWDISSQNLLLYALGVLGIGSALYAFSRYIWGNRTNEFMTDSDMTSFMTEKLTEGYNWDINNYYALLTLQSNKKIG